MLIEWIMKKMGKERRESEVLLVGILLVIMGLKGGLKLKVNGKE